MFIKRVLFGFLMLIAAIVFSSSIGMAQEPVNELESLQVSFWPDFDQPSVLVLMTGQLPEGSTLPAEISLPIPVNAEINAVAHIEETGMASIDYDLANGIVTFLTPNPRFRVEYYAPYEQDGRTRSYNFEWESTLSVAELATDVQQPANASSLSSEPEALDVFTNQTDGLVYHAQDPLSVPVGMPYQMSFSYEMASDGLTIEPGAAPPETTGQAATSVEEGDDNWLLLAGIVGIIALVMVGTWLVATRSSMGKSKRPRKPSPKKTTTARATVYCHVCGQPAEGDDLFCRQCGTELKSR